ncbi:leaf-specific thionin BTH6-like [Oryza glaberrima]|uniref:leaf-specific thionin BTH6-like n=1 Tax=Oryza glaberrima TaxID=4538 RepID=UPI00224C1A8B|nr:leaf-specific thionin BTH6-like [Oryza glaberrima]
MEGVKSLIMCALVLGLVLQQEKIHVEAKSCCPSTSARNVYNSCRFVGGSREACAKLSTCKHFDGSCQPPYDHLTLHSDTEESDVLDFCKLGCTSSVCSTINTFAVNEEGNGAVDSCNNARYRFCSKEAEVVTVAS